MECHRSLQIMPSADLSKNLLGKGTSECKGPEVGMWHDQETGQYRWRGVGERGDCSDDAGHSGPVSGHWLSLGGSGESTESFEHRSDVITLAAAWDGL